MDTINTAIAFPGRYCNLLGCFDTPLMLPFRGMSNGERVVVVIDEFVHLPDPRSPESWTEAQIDRDYRIHFYLIGQMATREWVNMDPLEREKLRQDYYRYYAHHAMPTEMDPQPPPAHTIP